VCKRMGTLDPKEKTLSTKMRQDEGRRCTIKRVIKIIDMNGLGS
jgi:hypothetical protein